MTASEDKTWRRILKGMIDWTIGRYYPKPEPTPDYRSGTNNHPGPPFRTGFHPFLPLENNRSICSSCGCRMTGHLLVCQGDDAGARRVEDRNSLMLSAFGTPQTLTGRRPSRPEYQTIRPSARIHSENQTVSLNGTDITPYIASLPLLPDPSPAPVESSGGSTESSSSSDFGGGESGGGGSGESY